MPLIVRNGDILTVSGLLATDVACCCDGSSECPCVFPTEWRIIDSNGIVYAKGPVVAAGGPGCDTIVPAFADFPSPFTPLFYWQAGELSLNLEVLGCSGDTWDTLDSWAAVVSLCDGGRYPLQPLDGPWQPPGQCACKNQQSVNDGIEECDPCPDLVPGSPGDGQAWRDPQPGTATTFTGAIDGEWTNLLNWEDANGLTPAGSLPGSGTNVSVEANVTSTAVAITVAELTIAAGAEFSVAASSADLHCYGAIERNALCDGVFGQVTVSGEAFVYGGGRNNGEIVNALVKFSGDGFNDTDGVVTGDARFDDTSRNEGAVTGDGEFYDTAKNFGTVQGDATFDGSGGPENFGTVKGDGVFRRRASNIGTVEGDAAFYDTSGNDALGIVFGSAAFYDQSRNDEGVVQTNATFNGNSINAGPVAGDAEFNDSSVNGESPNFPGSFGSVAGTATFNDTSANDGGTADTATFNDDSINRGDVTGTATFTGNACNDGGTAGTFVPDPPPSC